MEFSGVGEIRYIAELNFSIILSGQAYTLSVNPGFSNPPNLISISFFLLISVQILQ